MERVSLCEYPLMGGFCGEYAVCHGKTSGTPYCEAHKNLILRWATEKVTNKFIKQKMNGQVLDSPASDAAECVGAGGQHF